MSLKRLLQVIGLPVWLLLSIQVFAQDRVVTGKVTDSKDGSPVVGASVQPKGSSAGSSTGADGSFRVTVPSGINTLVISSAEFTSQEIDITGKTSADVSLVATAGGLSEVVVIGYGTVRKKDLTGAVGSVQAKDFNKGTYVSADQLIQGKVAGVQIINNSGQPGGATTVRIRGNSALTGSGQPLYVVDGVQLDGRSSRPNLNAQNLGNTPAGNPLNFINPADIASIDVLKDASATAIYGARAAYGVVLITLKKGASGQPRIDFSTSVGFSKAMRQIDVLDAAQYRSALTYYGVSPANDKGNNVDAMDEIMRSSAIQQNYNVGISGGNENAKYRFSLSLLDQPGIIEKTSFKKYTALFNAQYKFLESKKLGLDFLLIPSQYLESLAPVTNDAGSTGSLIGQTLQWNPTEPLRNTDGSFNIKAGDIVNPVAMLAAYNDNVKVSTIMGSISPYYKFTPWLEYRMLYSINYSTGNRRASVQQYINLQDIKDKGWASISNNELITEQFTNTLNFNKKIGTDLNLNALIGFEYQKFTNKGSSLSAYGPNGGFGNYGLDYTNYIQYSNAANRTIASFVDPTNELQSYFARATLNFRDRYLLTGTVRRDGSTKFGDENKYGTFPSFSAAWVINKEDFFGGASGFFSNLKLRAGWGITGNQEFPPGSSLRRYSFSNNGGLGLTNNPNPGLKWQEDEQLNIGIDFGIMKGRINGSVDYFKKSTTDLLYPTFPIQPAPPGTVTTWKNLDGLIENSGVEITLGAAIIEKSNFTWDLNVNATFLKNEVSEFSSSIPTGALHGQGVSGATVQVIQNGLPMNAFYTRQFTGMDKATGLATYTDNGSTFYYVGDPNPSTLLGISTTLRFNKLSFVANFNGAFGQDIYNNTLNNVINVGSINGGRNIAVSVYEDPIKESFANPVTASSRFIENGSYLKFANATLSYNFGNVGKMFSNANFYVTGQNLFVITDFQGFDPEVNVDKNVNGVPSNGIEYTPFPTARTISLGLNFTLK